MTFASDLGGPQFKNDASFILLPSKTAVSEPTADRRQQSVDHELAKGNDGPESGQSHCLLTQRELVGQPLTGCILQAFADRHLVPTHCLGPVLMRIFRRCLMRAFCYYRLYGGSVGGLWLATDCWWLVHHRHRMRCRPGILIQGGRGDNFRQDNFGRGCSWDIEVIFVLKEGGEISPGKIWGLWQFSVCVRHCKLWDMQGWRNFPHLKSSPAK